MTIILAAKYRGGVIVGYDPVSFTKMGGHFLSTKKPVHKFRQVGNFPVGMGISGDVDNCLFAQLEKFLENSPDLVQGIRDFTLAQKEASGYPHLGSGQHSKFLFTVDSEMRVGDNRRHSQTARVHGFTGIGSGYSGVKNIIAGRYYCGMPRDKVLQLVREGVSLAERLNWEDSQRYAEGRVISGLGITDVRDGRFEVLEFEKVNPYFTRQIF